MVERGFSVRFEEAPQDGAKYVCQNGSWVVADMAFVFPPNPNLGDAYSLAVGVSWVWNSMFWEYGTGLLIPFVTHADP